MRISQYTITLLILANISIATAGDEFASCKPFPDIAPSPPDLPSLKGDAIRLFADNALVQEQLGTSTFSGDVLMQREEQILSTRLVVYDRNQDIVNAEQDFTFWDRDFVISGSSLQLRPQHQGEMTNATYWLLTHRAQGQAAKLIRKSKDVIHLEQASYSTCNPTHEVWSLSADHVTLNDSTAIGTAHHATIRILDIPVFYTPYISFPIGDERKSGFLPPRIGSSDEAGTEFRIPYYLNLAPNYDATLIPRYMSRRGLLLGTEFRYLTKTARGKLELEYLPHDQAFGTDRSSLSLQHKDQITERWSADVNFNYVSDARYFEELGNNISMASITHLERRGDLYYFGDGWHVLGRLQAFQTLDRNPAARPYQRMPQLTFKTNVPEIDRKLHWGIEAELVRFDRNIEVVDGPIGNRLDFKPMISLPWRTPGTFIVPKLSFRHTRYDLDNVTTIVPTTHNRSLFTFSTDSGLFLERNVNLLTNELVQTLEPRLFYRYTQYKEQSDIPVFDTARYDLSFLGLFWENSFSGADRIDDGHQVAWGLTSRLLGNATGIEHLRASIGQIYYLRNQQVTLPNQQPETDSSSNLIMELASQFAEDWRVSSTLRWNPHTKNTEHTVLRMRYHPDQERILNLSYRMRDNSLEQFDTSLRWSLGPNWAVLGRWNYSLPKERTLETFTGIEYSSCCWAIRGITRRYLNNVDGFGYLNGFFIQFQLKGLGGIGKKADSFLEQRIPGYNDHF